MNSIEAIGALHDPLRPRLYEFVAAQGRDVGRHEAAEACGIQRTLAAFHLDKLVEAGLLEASYRRLTGRAGRVLDAPPSSTGAPSSSIS